MSEGVSPCDIVYEQGTGCSSIIGPCDGFERFLAGSVPNLQLDVFLVELDSASPKLDADGQVVLLTESLVCKLEQQA